MAMLKEVVSDFVCRIPFLFLASIFVNSFGALVLSPVLPVI